MPDDALDALRDLATVAATDGRCAIRDLSVVGYARGFTLWHYRAGDRRLDDVAAPGFFADAADMLAAGDMVLISARDGGRMAFIGRAKAGAPPTLVPLR